MKQIRLSICLTLTNIFVYLEARNANKSEDTLDYCMIYYAVSKALLRSKKMRSIISPSSCAKNANKLES